MDQSILETQQPGPGVPPTPDPRDRATGLPPDAPQSVVDVARGHGAPKGGGERSAVRFLLGQQRAPRYKVRVEFATDEGDLALWFTIKALDGKKIDTIEKAHTDRNTVMGEADDLLISAELVAEATVEISDFEPGTPEYETGMRTKPTDPEFLVGAVAAADALKARFHFQSGLLAGVANQIRRISGWAPDRVGQAQRVLVDVVGGS
jgi:hypothetical protein